MVTEKPKLQSIKETSLLTSTQFFRPHSAIKIPMSTSIFIQLCCYFTLFAANFIINSGADNVNNDSLDEAVLSTCPTWYMPASDDSEKCVCGDTIIHNNIFTKMSPK